MFFYKFFYKFLFSKFETNRCAHDSSNRFLNWLHFLFRFVSTVVFDSHDHTRRTSNEFHTICTRFKRLTIRNALKPNRKYSFRGWERDTNVNHSLYIYESLIIAQANIWTEAKVVYYQLTVFNSAGGDYSYEF